MHSNPRRIVVLALLTGAVLALDARPFQASQVNANTRPGSRAVASLSLSYAGMWGTKGDTPGKLDEPTCIATDALGNAYLADAGTHFVGKFAPDGHPLLFFEDDNIKTPQSIAVDAGGAIYVADAVRASAFIYFPNGDHYKTVKLKVHASSEDTVSVSVADDGMIHVLDGDAGSIFSYTSRLRLVHTWQPVAADGVRVRASNIVVGQDGFIYVADRAGSRILKFSMDGHFVAEVASHAAGSSRRLSDQFTVFKNYVFAMDVDGRGLHVWTTDGQPMLNADLGPEMGDTARSVPALAVSPRKELLVLDTPGARVFRYRLNF